MARLARGCQRLGLSFPDFDQIRQSIIDNVGATKQAVAKILVIRGGLAHGYQVDRSMKPNVQVMVRSWPDYPNHYWKQGVSIRWCQTRLSLQPALAGIKHLNRLEQVLARSEWGDQYVEGLMRDTCDRVIEGTKTNLFLVSKGTLITPDLSESGVAGVMRAEVIAQAGQAGIPVVVKPVTVDEVEDSSELFLTNSLIGMWPIAQIEIQNYDVAGTISTTLQKALLEAGCLV